MTPQQLAVPFEGSSPYPLLSPARRTGGDPKLDPFAKHDLVGRHMLAGIARADDAAQFITHVTESAIGRLAKPRSLNSIAQSPGVFPALIDAAVTAIASLGHPSSPFLRFRSLAACGNA